MFKDSYFRNAVARDAVAGGFNIDNGVHLTKLARNYRKKEVLEGDRTLK